jgi:lysophospholipase L1-like esterase
MKTIIVSLFILLFMRSITAQKNWRYIQADNDLFYYQGRFNKANPKEVHYDWSGTTIHFSMTGNKLQLLMKGGDRNYFNLYINDELHEVLYLPNDTIYGVDGIKGKGPHNIRLQKRTEGEMGTAIFKGINVGENEQLLPNAPVSRRIEFIGNSITCGYGTEGASREEDFLPSTENVDKSYAFITARAFDAECMITAHSGLGVIRNYGDKNKVSVKLPTMTDRYNQTLDEDSTICWDFNTWQPHAVIINLGTNDYWSEPYPDKIVFQHRYEKFINEIRGVYGKIPIFCICGPLRDEPLYSTIKETVEKVRLINKDSNLYFIGIPTYLLNNTNDLGSDWHPSYRGQRKMAAHIIPIIANILHWNYSNSEIQFDNTF